MTRNLLHGAGLAPGKNPFASQRPPDAPLATILVVDDLPDNVTLLSQLLAKRGYAVRGAHDGEAALASARETPPDLVLLDINMPGLSGYEVAQQFKKEQRLSEIPIIFLSSLDSTDDKVRAFASGGVDYVLKPFQFAEVDARISTHLKIRQLQIELEKRNRQYEQANHELRRVGELRENLTAASKFAMWWTYYQQFDFQSVEAECRQSALDFFALLDKLAARDQTVRDTLSTPPAKETVAGLREWANDSSQGPPTGSALTLTSVLLFLTLYRSQIEGLLQAGSSNTDQMVHPEVARRLEGYLRWRGHFPRMKTRADFQDVMEKAAHTPTIIVVGDIRRSQDLMTYALDERDFSARMVEFISRTRSLLHEHGGFFDKFTGDGFLGYFNQSICEVAGVKHVEGFIRFITEFTGFCNGHFREWTKFVRKVPGERVGLAMGADIGHVSFQSLDYHVVAVSESIVWASRMASAARAEEVLVNNLLYQALAGRGDLAFASREAATKSGESFQAWTMGLKPSPSKSISISAGEGKPG